MPCKEDGAKRQSHAVCLTNLGFFFLLLLLCLVALLVFVVEAGWFRIKSSQVKMVLSFRLQDCCSRLKLALINSPARFIGPLETGCVQS